MARETGQEQYPDITLEDMEGKFEMSEGKLPVVDYDVVKKGITSDDVIRGIPEDESIRRYAKYGLPPEDYEPMKWNREKFEQSVYKQLGGNPFAIDVDGAVNRYTDANVEKLFEYVFKDEVAYVDRNELDKKQRAYWLDTLKKFRADAENGVKSWKASLLDRYNGHMAQFDNKKKTYEQHIENIKKAIEGKTKEKVDIYNPNSGAKRTVHPAIAEKLIKSGEGWKLGTPYTVKSESKVWISNSKTGKEMQIKVSELDKYKEKGWEEGKPYVGRSENKIWISNPDTGKEMQIRETRLPEYIENGWEEGKPSSRASETKPHVLIKEINRIEKTIYELENDDSGVASIISRMDEEDVPPGLKETMESRKISKENLVATLKRAKEKLNDQLPEDQKIEGMDTTTTIINKEKAKPKSGVDIDKLNEQLERMPITDVGEGDTKKIKVEYSKGKFKTFTIKVTGGKWTITK